MTYKDLLERLQLLNDEQLNMNVTVHLQPDDEFFTSHGLYISHIDNDVLDENHPYISVFTE